MLSKNEKLNYIKEQVKLRCEHTNNKRHQYLITLITAAMSLCGDSSVFAALVRRYEFDPDDFKMDKVIKDKTREEVTALFEKLIPEICEDLYFKNSCVKKIYQDNTQILIDQDEELHPKYAFDEQCYRLISLLHEIILIDYENNKLADILRVLVNNKVSPISSSVVMPKHKTDDRYVDVEKITKRQRIVRSNLRKKLHHRLFSQQPSEFNLLPANIKNNLRLVSIIHELTASNAVINKIQYHWTTENNLKSIVNNGYFYGNKTLKRQRIFFRLNSLGTGDVDNGDNDIICFCPYMVDYLAFYSQTNSQFKGNVVRLSVNVQELDLEGRYNQFFKLFDLLSPAFSYTAYINDELDVKIEREVRGKAVFLTLILNGESKRICIFDGSPNSKNKVIHYGNLFSINRFCLLALFNFLSLSEDQEFEATFINYLNEKQDNEIKKILTIVAQALTVFAEYNFNSSLRLTDKMITEVHLVNKSVTYNFADYQKALNDSTGENNDALSSHAKSDSILSTGHTTFEKTINIYGNTVLTERKFVKFQEQNFIQHPADLFARDIYFETRPQQSMATNRADYNQVKLG